MLLLQPPCVLLGRSGSAECAWSKVGFPSFMTEPGLNLEELGTEPAAPTARPRCFPAESGQLAQPWLVVALPRSQTVVLPPDLLSTWSGLGTSVCKAWRPYRRPGVLRLLRSNRPPFVCPTETPRPLLSSRCRSRVKSFLQENPKDQAVRLGQPGEETHSCSVCTRSVCSSSFFFGWGVCVSASLSFTPPFRQGPCFYFPF